MITKISESLKYFVNFPYRYLTDLTYYIKEILTNNIDKLPNYKSTKEPRVAFCLYVVVGGIKGKSGDNKSSSEEILEIGFKDYKKHIFSLNKNVDIFIHTWSRDIKEEINRLYKP